MLIPYAVFAVIGFGIMLLFAAAGAVVMGKVHIPRFGRLPWKIDTALTAVVFMLGKWLESVRWICWLGKNSLPIFGIHSFILWAWIRVYCKTITHVDEEHPAVSIFTLLIIPVLSYACSALFVPFYQWGMRKLDNLKNNNN